MIAIFVLTSLGVALGFILAIANRFFKVETNPLIEEVAALMPGSNCGQCGFPGCTAAAEAIADRRASVTVCPPGGRALAEQLANKLSIVVNLSGIATNEPMVAGLNDTICIGCTRCLKVCPTDAIVGAPKQIHIVLVDACTGCGACIKECPTEGLYLQPVEVTLHTWKWAKPASEIAAA
ncbi:MAG: electron transporter RnfB [Beggiatoa sp. IS2]|nr:MAG: electron transporter RnfB [Beggiatoa sp. IS2]